MVSGTDGHADEEIHPDGEERHPQRKAVPPRVQRRTHDSDDGSQSEKGDVDPVFSTRFDDAPPNPNVDEGFRREFQE